MPIRCSSTSWSTWRCHADPPDSRLNLTARTFTFAALIAVLGTLEQWSQPLPFAVWRLAASAVVAALLYEWLRVRIARLDVTPSVDQRLALGAEERLELCFHNGSPRALTVMFAPALPESMESAPEPRRLEVPAHGTVRESITLRPTALGPHHWSDVPLRILGPLGLGWWSRPCRFDAVLDVVPDLLRAPARAVGTAERGSAARAATGSGAELHHLREYRPGDPRHTIDWKATARTGDLITRVYGEDQHLEVVIVLDAGRTAGTQVGGLTQLGHYVNAAARFVEHAAAAEDRVGVVAVADRLLASAVPQRGLAGVLHVRRVLAGLRPEPVETDLVRGTLEVQRLVRHRALVIVLTDLYGQDTGGRLAQSIRLLLPRHLPVVVSLMAEDLGPLAHRPASRWLDPYESLAAREYRTRVLRNASGLRRAGAHALVTTPQELDARVLSLYGMLRSRRRV